MQRKEFGKRGLTPGPGSWGQSQGARVAYASSASAAPHSLDYGGGGSSGSGSLAGSLFAAFDFTGRSSLLNYWVVGLAYLAFMGVMSVLFVFWFMGQGLESAEDIDLAMKQPAFYAFGLVYVVGSVFRWALEARRLHDRGVSALWILAWFIPLVGSFIMLWQWAMNCILPGDPGTNEYGPRP